MPALTKAERDALPDDAFAVPARRLHPLHDVEHVKMAWGELTNGRAKLSAEDAEAARFRVLQAAAEHGVDRYAPMHKIKGMSLQAMSLDLPDVAEHPNRHPFSGILVRLDEPSDLAPHGSDNKKVQITRAAAEKAIPSLLGMGVGLTAKLDGHDERNKVGLITAASVVDEDEGPAVAISGFFYASDFPDETARIRASADKLGFSFEARDIWVRDPKASVLEITDLAFTGAAVLFKDKAAYHKTSIAASGAAGEDFDMTLEEMKAALGELLAPVTAELTAMKASAEALKVENAALVGQIQASRVVLDKVEPFAAEAETLATKMKAAGIGSAARSGHADILERMASDMRAEAARGTIPSSFSAYMYAGAEKVETAPAKDDAALAAAVEAAVATAVAPMKAAAEKAAADLAAAEQKISDLKAAAVTKAAEPERKTLSAPILSLLASASIAAPEGDGKLAVKDVDAAFAKAGMNASQRLQAKAALNQAGVLA